MNLPKATTSPLIDEVRRKHFQSPNSMYCSVSAIEFVAKLCGLLPPDSFPLQSNPANQSRGFSDPDLLDALGLQGKDQHYDTQSALRVIEEETNRGRFPLVSLAMFSENGKHEAYHVHVVVKVDGQPILIDPANGQDRATTKEDLARVLELNSLGNQERKTIHIYHLEPKNG